MCTDCKALWGKFVICDIGPYKINWIEIIVVKFRDAGVARFLKRFWKKSFSLSLAHRRDVWAQKKFLPLSLQADVSVSEAGAARRRVIYELHAQEPFDWQLDPRDESLFTIRGARSVAALRHLCPVKLVSVSWQDYNTGYPRDFDRFTAAAQSESSTCFIFLTLVVFCERNKKARYIYIFFFTNCAAFPPTIIPCFEWSRIRSASPAVTETRSHCGQRVLTLTGCRNEEHLRYIRFATGWTVTLPYWAAGVKQGLTTPPPHSMWRWWGAAWGEAKGSQGRGLRGPGEVPV